MRLPVSDVVAPCWMFPVHKMCILGMPVDAVRLSSQTQQSGCRIATGLLGNAPKGADHRRSSFDLTSILVRTKMYSFRCRDV